MGFSYRIYLDCCCLNRPFDEQNQERIRLESEAILFILSRCQSAQWSLITSDVLDVELQQISDIDRYQKINILLRIATIRITYTLDLEQRAKALQEFGISDYDALHIASAEKGMADIFLTTDDRLHKKANRLGSLIKIKVNNPLQWLANILQEEQSNA